MAVTFAVTFADSGTTKRAVLAKQHIVFIGGIVQ